MFYIILHLQCVDWLKDASKIVTVLTLPWFPLIGDLDVVNGSEMVCVEESDFVLMAENKVAHGWSSALAEGTSSELTNLVPL